MKWTFIFRKKSRGLKGMYMRIYFFVLTTSIHLSNTTPDRCNNLCIEGGQSCRQYSRTIIVRKSIHTIYLVYVYYAVHSRLKIGKLCKIHCTIAKSNFLIIIMIIIIRMCSFYLNCTFFLIISPLCSGSINIRIAFRSLSNWKNWTWHSSSLPSHFFCCNASHNFSFLFYFLWLLNIFMVLSRKKISTYVLMLIFFYTF